MKILVLLFCIAGCKAYSQTLGGNATYGFLKLPSSAALTALGGINTSYKTGDVSLAANNPALLYAALTTQLSVSFNSFPGDSKTYSLSGAYHRGNTTYGGHIYFVDYGSIPLTDAAGNRTGTFQPVDFVTQVSAAKKYLSNWTYGASLKYIHSSYEQYHSSAIAADAGLLYNDSVNNFSASLLLKNMGTQLKTYTGEPEDLPFDLQVGITKRLSKAPFGFSLTAYHLHRFNTTYNDAVFNNDNSFSSPSSFNKIFNHFVIATHIYLGQNLEVTVGYNHLRQQELSIPDAGNGLAGFSAGLRIQFSKLQIFYARAAYQKGIAYNQISISTQLNKLVGLGK